KTLRHVRDARRLALLSFVDADGKYPLAELTRDFAHRHLLVDHAPLNFLHDIARSIFALGRSAQIVDRLVARDLLRKTVALEHLRRPPFQERVAAGELVDRFLTKP